MDRGGCKGSYDGGKSSYDNGNGGWGSSGGAGGGDDSWSGNDKYGGWGSKDENDWGGNGSKSGGNGSWGGKADDVKDGKGYGKDDGKDGKDSDDKGKGKGKKGKKGKMMAMMVEMMGKKGKGKGKGEKDKDGKGKGEKGEWMWDMMEFMMESMAEKGMGKKGKKDKDKPADAPPPAPAADQYGQPAAPEPAPVLGLPPIPGLEGLPPIPGFEGLAGTMPHLLGLPPIPGLEGLPPIPGLPLPTLPGMPALPPIPGVPPIAGFPPGLPGIPPPITGLPPGLPGVPPPLPGMDLLAGLGAAGAAGAAAGGQDRNMCKFFLAGNCSKGNKCTHSHSYQGAPGAADALMGDMPMAEYLALQTGAQVGAQIAAGEQIVSGRIRQYDKENRCATIASEAIHAACGHEVYCHESALKMANAGPGDTVLFFVNWNSKGMPQAQAPLIRVACDSFCLRGVFRKNAKNDFGFVDNALLKTVFGKDTFVEKAWAQLLDAGDILAFNASINKDGTPFFEMGQPCQPDWEAVPADLSVSRTSPDVQALALPQGVLDSDGKPSTASRGAYGGVIKLLSKASGFGYIESQPIKEQFGCDVHFVAELVQNQGQFTVRGGDVVRFELSPALQPGGKPQALSVSRANQLPYKKPRLPGESAVEQLTGITEYEDFGKSLKRPLTTGEVKVGVVKAYFPNNNYGFIECPEAKQKYGADVYCPGQYIRENPIGTKVEFEISVNKKGQPQAVDVRAIDDDTYYERQPKTGKYW